MQLSRHSTVCERFIDECIYLLIFSFSPAVRFRWCVECLGSAYTVARALNYVRRTCNQDELAEYQSDRPAVWRPMVLESGNSDRS